LSHLGVVFAVCTFSFPPLRASALGSGVSNTIGDAAFLRSCSLDPSYADGLRDTRSGPQPSLAPSRASGPYYIHPLLAIIPTTKIIALPRPCWPPALLRFPNRFCTQTSRAASVFSPATVGRQPGCAWLRRSRPFPEKPPRTAAIVCPNMRIQAIETLSWLCDP